MMDKSLQRRNQKSKERIPKKPKKRQGIYQRNDRKYEVPSTDKSDIYYGEVAKDKADEKAFHKHWS